MNGLAAVSADDVWAVGSAVTGRPLIAHWNGRTWEQVASSSPRGAQESLLTAIAATRSSNAWAVGYYSTGETIKTLIERWNGHSWTQVASPSPGGPRSYSALNGVAVAGKSSAWAVGDFGPPLRPLIERWNGRAWKFAASPNPGGRDGGSLNAVTTVGESGAWAAGNVGTGKVDETLIERWNGRVWEPVATPAPAGSRGSDLTAIAALSSARAWAVGYYFARAMIEPAVFTLIDRWNGRAWKQEPSPSPGGTVTSGPDQSLLEAVCAISSSQAWAAGSYSSGNPADKILIERRHGGSWTYRPAT